MVARPVYVALALSLTGADASGAEKNAAATGYANADTVKPTANAATATHLRAENRIRDLLRHPAFTGFARLTLPWDDRRYDEDMPLSDLGQLLPYHSQVDQRVVLAGLNRMIDDAGAGRTIFYDFYTDGQKREDLSKEHAGLFFFRGRPGAPFAVLCPGGGFSYVGSIHEGFPYAAQISGMGYNAFVLKYRVGQGGGVATEDLAAAIAFIVRNARELGVGVQGYSLWGSSAGARMAAAIGSRRPATYAGAALPRPAAIVMAYTAHADVSPDEPPTFAVVGELDRISPPASMERRVKALRESGMEVEYRQYAGLGHGFGLATGTAAEGWLADATRFWERFIRTGN